MGWGAALRNGLLAVVTVTAAACARLPLKPADAGFHAARPFRRPAAGAGVADREALFRAQRVTVNRAGFQAGAVPMDSALLRAYLRESGAPDLADKVLSADRRVKGWRKASDETQENFTRYPIPGMPAAFGDGVRLGVLVMAGISEAERSRYADAAAQFNTRLLQALKLPVRAAQVDPVAPRPEPLGTGPLSPGLNASFEDRVWERSIHRVEGPPGWIWPLGPVYRPWIELIGGAPSDGGELREHMAFYGGADEAGRYASGRSLRSAGEWTGLAGAVACLAGFTLFFAGQPPYQQGNLGLGLGGAAVAVLGGVLGDRGQRSMDRAMADFDAALPARLRLKMRF